jgi:hypothetical protein
MREEREGGRREGGREEREGGRREGGREGGEGGREEREGGMSDPQDKHWWYLEEGSIPEDFRG